jgi:hypothetical protein
VIVAKMGEASGWLAIFDCVDIGCLDMVVKIDCATCLICVQRIIKGIKRVLAC